MFAPSVDANGHITVLSHELWDHILNGADPNGRALLDPRFRFAARMTCRLWHAVVSSPSEADRRRIVATLSAMLVDPPRITAEATGRMAIGAAVCASAMADLFAASDDDSALETLTARLAPSTDIAVWRWRLVDAMAASGVDRHFDRALALPDRESVRVCVATGERAVDSYSALPAYYRMCIHRHYVRGADVLANLLSLDDLRDAATVAILHDRPSSLMIILAHICRRHS
ncbi:F-box domain containing protein [Pandoravirus salinus]|uniref:F-box domain containing protein n=1 Tax=Pandoravirus salinus TaxID=1349410 RepID=S4W3M9_9VIRU|nr:F-box domain [Pandoravirus salinus]AGO85277.1 F-box domain containing protein [Pandoravirus salinus]